MARIQYNDDIERASIISEQAAFGHVLIEEQDFLNGKFLLFELASVVEEKTDMEAISLKIAKVLFQHENRIRALEGKVAINKAQFLAVLKSL